MAFRHFSKPSTLLVLTCFCTAGQGACNKAQEQVPQGGRAEVTAKRGDKRAADEPAQVRCADLITKAEVTALGLPAEPYNETADPKIQAARCSFGDLSAAIWRGDKYASLVDGVKRYGKAAGIAEEDGPPVGVETQWTSMAGAQGSDGERRHTLNFVPPNRKFTASITGTDRSQIEQVANTLLAKFQKM
jgi:hypothetical protein